ncbi:prepilin peptidase [Methylobacterium sp. WL12]|uniref:prepilin peptidase n=1 Tax=Methylobacterium sp. WL12 TaxID=2603890 RepID=UPI0011CA7128|nr:A24 family peptidase [Methylobacterium sp. WL12]TXM72382.1 prepilin peptidase [Methylobacterium sp. WL12]
MVQDGLGAILGAPLVAALLPLPLTLTATAFDLRHRIIPDLVNLALFALGLSVAAWREPEMAAVALRLAEAGLAFVLFLGLRALHARLRGRVGLGLGDVKFLGAATVWTGLAGLPLLVLTASVTALGAILIGRLAGARITAATRLPFGPFLALGLHAALLAGHHAPQGF